MPRSRKMTRKHFTRLAAAFNATCKSLDIEGKPLSILQAQFLFGQLALAASEMGDNFAHGKFEDACQAGFDSCQGN